MVFREARNRLARFFRRVPADARRRRGRLTKWLVLGLAVANLLAPLGLPLNAAGGAPATTFANEAAADAIVICTPGGLILVRLDGNGEPIPGGDGDADLCIFCLPLCNPNACVPGGIEVAFRLIHKAIAAPAPYHGGITGPATRAGPISPRAPPLPFI